MSEPWRMERHGGSHRVVVTKDLPGKRWKEILTAIGCDLFISESREILAPAEIASAIRKDGRCDGAIGQLTEPWGAELFEALAQAGGRVYSNYAVGYDNVRVEEATRRKIAVGNTPGVLTETTAEMAVALTFAAARRIVEADAHLRAGSFRGWLPDLFLGKRLHGGTLGIIGAGRIGAAYAKMLAPGHRMSVLYHDERENAELEDHFRRLGPLIAADGGKGTSCRRAGSIEEVLRASDVVSLHVPLSEATRRLMNRERLRLMKPDAILVNTSRGPVIDEAALVEHLKDHPDFRVGLDVFEREPELAPGLAALPNAIIVPHIASATTWTREGMATLAALNVAGILAGRPVAKSLDVEKCLEGPVPSITPSIVNAGELGLELA
jgi:hydroxypyruvate reductase 1